MSSTRGKVVLPGYSKLPPTTSDFYKKTNVISQRNEQSSISERKQVRGIPSKDKEEAEMKPVYEKPDILQIPSPIERESLNFSALDYIDSDEE